MANFCSLFVGFIAFFLYLVADHRMHIADAVINKSIYYFQSFSPPYFYTYPRDAGAIQKLRKLTNYGVRMIVSASAEAEDVQFSKDAKRNEFSIDGPYGPVEIVMLTPPNAQGMMPLVVYFHGGGMVFGEPEDALMWMFGRHGNAITVGVDYSLAPEKPFPRGILDCYAVLEYLVEHSSEFSIDPQRVIVSGASAGGLMASVTAAISVHGYGGKIRKLEYPLAGQVLLVPVIDYPGGKYPSYLEFAHMGVLPALGMQWFWQMYISNPDNCTDYLCNPMFLTKDQLSSLPKAVLATASCDVLRDEGRRYKERLVEAGVETQHFEIKGSHAGAAFDKDTLGRLVDAVVKLIQS